MSGYKDSDGHDLIHRQRCHQSFGLLPIGLIQFRGIHARDVQGEARLIPEDHESVPIFNTDHHTCEGDRIRRGFWNTSWEASQCQGYQDQQATDRFSSPCAHRFLHLFLINSDVSCLERGCADIVCQQKDDPSKKSVDLGIEKGVRDS